MRIKLSEWAKRNGVCYRTAWNWVKEGKMPCQTLVVGKDTILVEEKEPLSPPSSAKIFVYARVSSSNKKDDLKNQASLCERFCAQNGLIVDKTFKEIASGMNDNRKILNKILDDPPQKLIVLYKDRLTRFGFNYLEKLLSKLGCEVIVINKNASDKDDLLKDFVAVITSFCCRLYGARRGQSKALKIKGNLND